MSTMQDLTIRKSITVDCSVEQAFEVFTERLASWWPLETHSIGGMAGEPPETAAFEPRAGGRVYERTAAGEENDWATVVAWEPPTRVVVDWHVNPDNPSTELEVRFSPQGAQTRVDLEHRGWERYGGKAPEAYDSYNGGWDAVLGRFVEAAKA